MAVSQRAGGLLRSVAPPLLLVLLLTGCAATLDGDGTPATSVGGPARSSEPPTAEPSTSSPPPSTTTSPESTSVEPAGLACPEPTVAPPGAPYCYALPAELDEIDLGDPTAGEEGSFRTSYGFGPADHIDVQAYVVGVDTDGLSTAEIIAELAGVVADLEAGGFDFADDPEQILVGGARGFAYPGTSTDGSQVITAHFVFRGVNEIQLNCAVTERPNIIDRACADVLATMQVTSG